MSSPVAPSTRTATAKPIRALVVGLVFIGAALFGFFRLYQQWSSADASGGWPTTVGTISASSLTHRETLGGGPHDSWTVHVSYSYSVEGKRYDGAAIHLGSFPSYSTEAEARAVLARYPEGATTSVSYDPAVPTNAVLQPGAAAAGSSLEVSALLLVCVLALGLAVTIQGARRMKAG